MSVSVCVSVPYNGMASCPWMVDVLSVKLLEWALATCDSQMEKVDCKMSKLMNMNYKIKICKVYMIIIQVHDNK